MTTNHALHRLRMLEWEMNRILGIESLQLVLQHLLVETAHRRGRRRSRDSRGRIERRRSARVKTPAAHTLQALIWRRQTSLWTCVRQTAVRICCWFDGGGLLGLLLLVSFLLMRFRLGHFFFGLVPEG